MRQDEEDPKTTEEDSIAKRPVSRREFLKYAGLAGAVVGAGGGLGGLLAACGDGETTTTAGVTTTAGGATTTAGVTTTAGATTTTMAGPEPPAQDKIVIGASRSLSGPGAFFEENAFGPGYKIWVEDVNAAGGITVAGKPLPVEMLVYDDGSDLDTAMRLLTKLMEEDKVDFVFPPQSTAFLFAASGVANAHGYIMQSGEGGATTLEQEIAKGNLPLHFQALNYSNHYQMPAFADICAELGIKTAAVVYLDDLHGIEYQAQAAIYFSTAGIQIVMNTAIPMDIKDMTSIVRELQNLDADAVCFFSYPPQNILAFQTMMQLNYNPRALLVGPGGSFRAFTDVFGDAIMEGVMFEGAWSIKSSPEAAAYHQRMLDFGVAPDYWGALIYRGELEFFQQAIEQAATLDNLVVAEVMRTAHFPTAMSPDTFYTNQIWDFSVYTGQIGQYFENRRAEVIDVGDKRTEAPLYPKPPWPAA